MHRLHTHAHALLALLPMLAEGCKPATEAEAEATLAADARPVETKSNEAVACTLEATQWVERQLVTACQSMPAGLDDERLPLAPWKPEPGELEGVPIVLNGWVPDDPLWLVRGEDPAPRWHLGAEHDVPGSRINAVIDELARMGATEGTILVRTAAGPQRDEPRDPALFARLQAELDGLPGEEQHQRLQAALHEHAAVCAARGNRVETILHLALDLPCETRSRVARELLVACDCPGWGDAFVTTLRLLVGQEMAVAAFEVALAPDAPLRPDDADTWGAFVAKLGPGKVTLRVEPSDIAMEQPDEASGDLAARLEAARKEREKAQVVQGKLRITGDLSTDIVRRIVRAHLNEVRHCYQRAVETDPKLAGELEVAFPIRANGQPGTATIQSSTLHAEGLGECVVSAVARWTFPRPPSGEAHVVQSFAFSRTD
jgi:hypothetical protein